MRNLKFDQIAPLLKTASQGFLRTVKSRDFQKGIMLALPSAVALSYEIYKLKRDSAEKESLYKKALAKDQAILKELKERTDLDKERQDRLLAYDSELKKEMQGLLEEIKDLKEQVSMLEKKKARE